MTLPLIALLDCTPIPNYKDLSRLDGRAFVVLGGGNGIGRQTCHALAQSGARLFCVDRNEAFATAVASETAGRAIVADVTRRADVERIFSIAEEEAGAVHGCVDIVGMPHLGPLSELDDARWGSQFDLVLTHAFLATQIGGAGIARARGGAIVFVASMSGMTRIPGQVAYGSAKAALIQLVAGASQELGPSKAMFSGHVP